LDLEEVLCGLAVKMGGHGVGSMEPETGLPVRGRRASDPSHREEQRQQRAGFLVFVILIGVQGFMVLGTWM
jgi:selenophosphate synthase